MSVDSIAKHKSMAFSKRIVSLYKYLTSEHKEYVMSKQLLRSGTSIGANIAEAIYGCSRKDFLAKIQISLKECSETLYWLELLNSCSYIPNDLYTSLQQDCDELRRILSSTAKSTMKYSDMR